MQTISGFDRIGEENAFAVLARAGTLAAQGMDVINLGIGQPDFPTPETIVEAAVKALRDGQHGYTPATGLPQFMDSGCHATASGCGAKCRLCRSLASGGIAMMSVMPTVCSRLAGRASVSHFGAQVVPAQTSKSR